MSVVFYDVHSDSFLIGIGVNLYRYANQTISHLMACGSLPPPPPDEKKLPPNNEPAFVIGVSANSRGKVAVVCNNKAVEVLDGTGRLAGAQALKRPTSVKITDSHIVVSDKAGDCYSFTLDDLCESKYLLGHVSVVLDTAMTSDHLLITSDRDEKIRVSRYPNCYNIEGYLLGHTEYVHKILLLSDNLLVSIGGDRKLMLWDLETYSNIQTITSEHGDYITMSYSAPYLLIYTARHITVYRVSDDAKITQISETTLDQTLVSAASSPKQVLVLSNKPELMRFAFHEGILSDGQAISTEDSTLDLSEIVCTHLPDKKKTVDTAGFKEYFERKKRRIEEETIKEEMKSTKVS